jgi:hypothetical protein
VARFYKNVEESVAKYKFPPTNADKVDETGISTVQKSGMILAPKDRKEIVSVTNWEAGRAVSRVQ